MNKITEGWYWVQMKPPYKKDWERPHIMYLEQDIIDFREEEGWEGVNLICKIEPPTEGVLR